MPHRFIQLCNRIELLRDMDNDPEAFHVERDEILWKIVESVAKGKLTQVQVMSLKRRLTPIMREDVWYS